MHLFSVETEELNGGRSRRTFIDVFGSNVQFFVFLQYMCIYVSMYVCVCQGVCVYV